MILLRPIPALVENFRVRTLDFRPRPARVENFRVRTLEFCVALYSIRIYAKSFFFAYIDYIRKNSWGTNTGGASYILGRYYQAVAELLRNFIGRDG